MKIIHINQTDRIGGAAIGVYRLHTQLLDKDINSNLLVDMSSTTDKTVDKLPERTWLDYKIRRLIHPLGFNDLHLTSTFKIPGNPLVQKADLLHLHNLHGQYFNYLALPVITRDKPTIITLHDMWGITGHCAYSFDCERWKNGCGNCPYPDSEPPVQRDATLLEWKFKHWAYNRSNLAAVVTTSQWMKAQIEESMLGHLPVYCFPYGLDVNVYRPLDKDYCRDVLGIPKHKNVLLFAAQHFRNHRKGGDLLLRVLQQFPDALKKETVLLILGAGGEEFANTVGLEACNLGFVESDHLKAVAYSAADLFLFPTRVDAFGLVAQESIACGTPVVAFGVGGVPDIVRPGITGLLAEPENPISFRDAIVQLLEDSESRQRMGEAGRAIAASEYSIELYAQRYIDLYEKVLQST